MRETKRHTQTDIERETHVVSFVSCFDSYSCAFGRAQLGFLPLTQIINSDVFPFHSLNLHFLQDVVRLFDDLNDRKLEKANFRSLLRSSSGLVTVENMRLLIFCCLHRQINKLCPIINSRISFKEHMVMLFFSSNFTMGRSQFILSKNLVFF